MNFLASLLNVISLERFSTLGYRCVQSYKTGEQSVLLSSNAHTQCSSLESHCCPHLFEMSVLLRSADLDSLALQASGRIHVLPFTLGNRKPYVICLKTPLLLSCMRVNASWCEHPLLHHLARSFALCAITSRRVGFVQTPHLRQIQNHRSLSTHNVACVELVWLHTFEFHICHALVVKTLMRSIVCMKVNARLGRRERRIDVGGAAVHQHMQGQYHLRALSIVMAIRELVDIAMTQWLVSMPELSIPNQQAPTHGGAVRARLISRCFGQRLLRHGANVSFDADGYLAAQLPTWLVNGAYEIGQLKGRVDKAHQKSQIGLGHLLCRWQHPLNVLLRVTDRVLRPRAGGKLQSKACGALVRCKQAICNQTRIGATHMFLACSALNHYEIRDSYRHLPGEKCTVIAGMSRKNKHLFSRIDAVNYIEIRECAGVSRHRKPIKIALSAISAISQRTELAGSYQLLILKI